MRRTRIFLGLLPAVLSACGSDSLPFSPDAGGASGTGGAPPSSTDGGKAPSGGEGPGEDIPVGQVDAPAGTSFLVQVLSGADDAPIAGAKVIVGAKEGVTDDTGNALFENLDAGELTVGAEVEGFIPKTSNVALEDGMNAGVTIKLLPEPPPVAFSTDEEGTVESEEVAIELPAFAFVDESGNPVTGEIEAVIAPVDPSNEEAAFLPGPLTGKTDDGEETKLESLFVAEISFEAGGQSLQLAEGVTAKIRFDLPSSLIGQVTDGTIVPAWTYDAAQGLWVEESDGLIVDDGGALKWEVEVSHFSWWMAGSPIKTTAVGVTVEDGTGAALAGLPVIAVGQNYPATDGPFFTSTNGKTCVSLKIGAVAKVGVGDVGGDLKGAVEVTAGSAESTCDSPAQEVTVTISTECTPGASQVCEDSTQKGACAYGARTCSPLGAWSTCASTVKPAPELCTGTSDEDCDGDVNEDCDCTPGDVAACYDGDASTNGVGLCKGGVKTCGADGKFSACEGQVIPSQETCTSPGDEDCDGEINEEGIGCKCKPGEEQECYSGEVKTLGVGPCSAGSQVCDADGLGFGECKGEVLPSDETCSTLDDDDCDGKVNEEGADCVCSPGSEKSCYPGDSETLDKGICKAGKQSCNTDGLAYGDCTGATTPGVEDCDAAMVDEDCDGSSNEEGANCKCVPGEKVACYTGPEKTLGIGQCAPGLKTCSQDGLSYGECMNEVVPQTETCDAELLDEDCDGAVNEDGAACACTPNATRDCYNGKDGTSGVGECHGGTQTCDKDGRAWGKECVGEVVPQTEDCDAALADEDCDGKANEEGKSCECYPGQGRSCYTGTPGTQFQGNCYPGVQHCLEDGLTWGSCADEATPGVESCTVQGDEDCDGEYNEEGEGCVCKPYDNVPCYSGPQGTAGVGRCSLGYQYCDGTGQSLSECFNETLPADAEDCKTPTDDNCNGEINEGCECKAGEVQSCYSKPEWQVFTGICKPGTQTCDEVALQWGPCVGEVTPQTEVCDDEAVDEDCDGQWNEEGTGCVCKPEDSEPCYSGDPLTAYQGLCMPGYRTCDALGQNWSACQGEILPAAEEDCGTPDDDNCNGEVNEDCPCVPGSTISCYPGPESALGNGPCVGGTSKCQDDGTGYTACEGWVLPTTETCSNDIDDDCNGVVNDGYSQSPGGGGSQTNADPTGGGSAAGGTAQTDCVCYPNSEEYCYKEYEAATNPQTMFVGVCKPGLKLCNDSGSAATECTPPTTPNLDPVTMEPTEICGNDLDDDCDYQIDEDCPCTPNDQRECFTGSAGPPLGICKAGMETCDQEGKWGPCEGQILPTQENCDSPEDEDCDGSGECKPVCAPGQMMECYNGIPSSMNVGICKGGLSTCNDQGQWGMCEGEVIHTVEDCGTQEDESCDGFPDCVCEPFQVSACYTGPEGTLGVGVCTGGTVMCSYHGAWDMECKDEVLPLPEICDNGIDEDCTGVADDGCQPK